MKVSDVINAIEELIPLKLAQGWDNVGLLIGNKERQVKNVLVTIDITRAVLEEARRLKADMIISYHPTIWDGLKKITPGGPGEIVYELIRSDIAVYSMHTALDAVAGGVNDGLAGIIGIADAEPIGDYVANPAGDNYKLVVFVPVDAVEKVGQAMFDAGAGHIGNYSRCSFRSEGTGTFLPMAGANPAIGSVGKMEQVEEIKFETIVPGAKLAGVLSAMREAHPYEVPAFDVIKMHDSEVFGLGRMGILAKPLSVAKLIEIIKKKTGAKAVGIVGPVNRTVKKAAVCAGSCGKILNAAMGAGCDLYLTGELKHHQAIAAQEAGLTCLCLSHSVSERFILAKFAAQLKKLAKPVTISVSKKDADPFVWKNI